MSRQPHPLRVLVVEEHAGVRSALVAALSAAAEIQEVRATGSPERAERTTVDWQPDVILLEIKRRDGKGLALCRTLAAAAPGARILVVTSYPSALEELAATKAHVAGYVLKETDPDRLLHAIIHATTPKLTEVRQPCSNG